MRPRPDSIFLDTVGAPVVRTLDRLRSSTHPVVSTIEIRGADASDVVLPSGANNGPRLNVVPGVLAAGTPGPTLVNVLIGQQADVASLARLSTIVQNAVRAFKSGVNVVAVSQPIIAQGATGLAGNIKITETLAGQFKARTGHLRRRSCRERSTGVLQARQDTFLATANQNQLPVVTTNVASGLLASRTVRRARRLACFTINAAGHAARSVSSRSATSTSRPSRTRPSGQRPRERHR